MTKFNYIACYAPLCAALLAGSAQAQDITKLANELSTLRSDVEALSGQLSEDKADLQDQLRTYARQKSELMLELDREQIRLQKLRLAVAQKQKDIEAQKLRFKDLMPTFEGTATALEGYIQHALPFRKEERLSELQRLRDSLRGGLLSPPNAMLRLWSMMEDEFRMARESGMFRQTIDLDGQAQLADVVRLGMVTMYFKTSEGQIGHSYRTGDGWAYKTLDDKADVELVETLFDSFKKHIRTGLFTLPEAVIIAEGK